MIATITNLSASLAINSLQVEDSGASLGPARVYAIGGARLRPLPYPFMDKEIAASGTSILPVRPRDLRQREGGNGNAHGTHEAGEVWNQVVAMGRASFAQGAQTGRTDVEEIFTNAV